MHYEPDHSKPDRYGPVSSFRRPICYIPDNFIITLHKGISKSADACGISKSADACARSNNTKPCKNTDLQVFWKQRLIEKKLLHFDLKPYHILECVLYTIVEWQERALKSMLPKYF